MHSFRNFLLSHPLINPYGFTYDRFLRNITFWCRTYPDVIIIGNNKSASNTVFYNLIKHPQILGVSRRENRFFDANFWRGKNWYKSHFPTIFKKVFLSKQIRKNIIILDSSPTCYIHPYAATRMKKLLPKVKIVIIFRNPIDHAYSLYYHRVRMKSERLTFEESIKEDKERAEETHKKWLSNSVKEHTWKDLRIPYLSDSLYIDHIEKWFSQFNKNDIFIIDMNELAIRPKEILNNLCGFLEISSYRFENYEVKNVAKDHPRKGPYPPMNKETREMLVNYFREPNNKLEKFLNMKFDWDK